jgi:hypothetical protein
VALEGKKSVVFDHAVSVVDDANELATASFDLDADAGGVGIEGVFEELFDDGCRTLDDFTSSDLVRHYVREDANAAHGLIVMGSSRHWDNWGRFGSSFRRVHFAYKARRVGSVEQADTEEQSCAEESQGRWF